MLTNAKLQLAPMCTRAQKYRTGLNSVARSHKALRKMPSASTHFITGFFCGETLPFVLSKELGTQETELFYPNSGRKAILRGEVTFQHTNKDLPCISTGTVQDKIEMFLEESHRSANFFSINIAYSTSLKLILKANGYTIYLTHECKFMEVKCVICVCMF